MCSVVRYWSVGLLTPASNVQVYENVAILRTGPLSWPDTILLASYCTLQGPSWDHSGLVL